jgi:hypothetical protein
LVLFIQDTGLIEKKHVATEKFSVSNANRGPPISITEEKEKQFGSGAHGLNPGRSR